MSVFEASKDFLGSDPNQRFLDFPPPRGYDPLALDREISRAVAVIGDLLREKWEHQKVKTGKPADAPKGSGRRSDRLKLKKG
jgi:hypothetical protein